MCSFAVDLHLLHDENEKLKQTVISQAEEIRRLKEGSFAAKTETAASASAMPNAQEFQKFVAQWQMFQQMMNKA